MIFEFGSGYGHSAFWYFLHQNSISKVYLTERRDDLLKFYNEVPFPNEWRNKIHYHQGDAFELLEQTSGFDFVLIDGQKNSYTDFLKAVLPKMKPQGLIAVDNAFWKGAVIGEGETSATSAEAILEHHKVIKQVARDNSYRLNYFPFRDGLLLLEV